MSAHAGRSPRTGRRLRGGPVPSATTAMLGRRLLVLGAVALLAGAGYLAWLRDSSLVAVEQVSVTGLSTRDAAQMRSAITEAARGMTTLHVRQRDLEGAVADYPVVRSIEATPDFPDRLAVHVVERRAVASVSPASGAADVPVAADGTLLRGARPGTPPARVRAEESLTGDRLRDRRALALVRVLAAAPAPLAARPRGARWDSERGVVVALRAGPEVVFGDATSPRAKWAAGARVLATPVARGASYIDVRLPDRPAAGGVAPADQTTVPAPASTRQDQRYEAQPIVEGVPVPNP